MLLSFFSSIKHILLVLTLSKTHSSSLPSVKNQVLFFLSSFLPLLTHSDMDSNPYNQMSNFVDLLESQQHTVFGYVQGSVELCSSQVPLFFTQSTEASIPTQDTSVESIQRRKWTPIDDVVLISTWLNTSKNHVVGNEQRSGAFWKRIAAYFAASPKVAGCE